MDIELGLKLTNTEYTDELRLAISEEYEELNREDALKFNVIYWNFPHAGAVNGFRDGHPYVQFRHVNLMRKFFRSARSVVEDGSIIKVTTNQNATGVNAKDLVATAQDSGFKLANKSRFDDWELSDYDRAFGDYRDAKKRKSKGANGGYDKSRSDKYGQNRHADHLFEFVYDATIEVGPLKLQDPPSINTFMNNVRACSCGLLSPKDDPRKADGHLTKNDPNHQEVHGPQKMAQIEEFLMSFSDFL